MSEYFVRRLAEMLTKGEVFELFKMLEQRYGTIAAACERVGIERKTFYNWKYARQMNIETKTKVLKTALEEHPIDTLEFLAKKSRERTREILSILLTELHKEVVQEDNPENLKNLVNKAEKIIEEFSIPVIEYLEHEVTNLMRAFIEKGLKLRLEPVLSIENVYIQPYMGIEKEYREGRVIVVPSIASATTDTSTEEYDKARAGEFVQLNVDQSNIYT